MRKLIRGEGHHWWPMSLSRYWTNEKGRIGRITPNDRAKFISPKGIAKIGDGHNILFDEPSPWESTFEDDFDSSDSDFPGVVDWLGALTQQHTDGGEIQSHESYRTHDAADEDLSLLTSCLSSLVVRSPRYRNAMTSAAESFRGPLGKKELKRLAAFNLLHKQEGLSKALGHRGKFVVLFSQESEFIFGDGFYNNIPHDVVVVGSLRILAPITPSIAVLFARPLQFAVEPRLMTRLVNMKEVHSINETVQIYSKDYLFFRTDRPELSEHFAQNEHLTFEEGDPVDAWISDIPGVTGPWGHF